ncbi:MAG TPA: hypothetical protein PK668_10265 [Myxococcota bacterium]|nr:hypothetical protein [Myxococcota bacterium]HRY93449.1 hypothetical protein [Myxococcota bacterium]HSA20296.1 hypothetical protein [Myxococcota bacterium]
MAEVKKGDRVVITGGKDRGKAGVVFWVGPGKYGRGLRLGLRTDGGETAWAGLHEVELEGPAQPGAASPPPDRRFDPDACLAALRRHLERHDDRAVERELEKIPVAARAAWLWEHVGRGRLPWHQALLAATADRIAEVPLETVVAALEARDAQSQAAWLPGAGDQVLELLVFTDCREGSYLHGRLADLPRPLQRAFWLARGMRRDPGGPMPADLRAELAAALPAHARSGRMGPHTLEDACGWLGLALDELRGPGREALAAGEGPLPLRALGALLAELPAGELAALAPRLEPAHLQTGDLVAFLEARAARLPDEPPDGTLQAFEAVAARIEDWAREPPAPAWGRQVTADRDGLRAARELACRDALQAVEAGALALAGRRLAAGQPVPDALLGHFSRFTECIDPWMPALQAVAPPVRARLLARLQGLLPPHHLPGLAPLELLVDGQAAVERLLAELEEGVRQSKGVSVEHLFTPLGKLGAIALAPLSARIEQRTAELDPAARPAGEGYRPRRVVLALRNALAVALAEAAGRGRALDPRLEAFAERHLGPEPATLFEGNDDFPYCFFLGLQKAQALFAALPEARVRAWIEAWRGSGRSAHLEERLRSVLPTKRRAWLGKPRSLAARVAAQAARAEEAGLPCTQPVYLLSRGRARKRGALGGIRARPRGLAEGRWPRGPSGPYAPVLCLDLAEMPELAARFPGSRGLCLLVDSTEEGFEASALLPLSAEEASAGLEGGAALVVERVEVPPGVFEPGPLAEPLAGLRRLLREAPGRVLGRPFFLQQDPSAGDERGFVLQAGGGLLQGVNLGDSGVLYLYEGEAFWECR